MDSLLEIWLPDHEAIQVVDEASVSAVRDRVREVASDLPDNVRASLVNIASELARNQLRHARDGHVVVQRIDRDGVPGVEVVAADRGEGIAQPTEALAGRPRHEGSLGVGLAAVLELSHEVDFDVRMGEGTCVWSRRFAEPVARARQVGIWGRPCPGEGVSGDAATFARDGDSLLLAVADGLGHGHLAREASDRFVSTLRAKPGLGLEALLGLCHDALDRTRGAVVSISRIAQNEAQTACVGNVTVHISGPGSDRRFSGPSFVLGAPGKVRRFTSESCAIDNRDALIAFTDGLTTRTDTTDLALLREHPIIVAHELAVRFGRDNDDILVAVAR